MAARSTAAGHRRTRSDHALETAEDYVEAVADIIDRDETCRVKDLSERFGVSHVTVVRIVKRLQDEGYLETERHKPITLTTRGRRMARDCRERHDTVYRFLLAIGVPEQVAVIDAEGIEHHVSRQTLERFRCMTDAAVR